MAYLWRAARERPAHFYTRDSQGQNRDGPAKSSPPVKRQPTSPMTTRKKSSTKRVDGIPPRPNKQLISLKQAQELTERYRRAAPASPHGGFFFGKWIEQLLSQPGVTGLRFYHGLDNKGNHRMILVGVDDQGRDVVKTRSRGASPKSTKAAGKATTAMLMSATTGDSDAVIIDSHWPCPPWCWPGSPL